MCGVMWTCYMCAMHAASVHPTYLRNVLIVTVKHVKPVVSVRVSAGQCRSVQVSAGLVLVDGRIG